MSNHFNFDDARKFLLEISDILDGEKIPFFLMQGTALGAYRDNGFTPTERDVDLGFLKEDFEGHYLIRLLGKAGFDWTAIASPFAYIRTIVVSKYGIKADLVSFAEHTLLMDYFFKTHDAKLSLSDSTSSEYPIGYMSKRGTKVRYACSPVDPINVHRPYAIVHEAVLLEHYESITFFGKEFKIPTPISVYLEREYGNDWKTPKEDHISRSRIYNFLDKERIL